MPSPATCTAGEVNTRFVASQTAVEEGPYSLKVMVPPALGPSGPWMIGLPGLLAVPLSPAWSETLPPRVIGPEAVVGIIGTTGLTTKHSFAEESLASGTPLVPDVKTPRQQYLPADVTCAAAERIGNTVVLSTEMPAAAPICVPPVEQVS